MKAMLYTHYGSPDVLRLETLEKPTPADNEVLVRVHAASLNATDVDMLRGAFLNRLGGPLKPAHRILGSDIAGRVEAVGRAVTQFQPGDAVIGDLFEYGFGAFADYVAVPEHALTPKPASMSFEQAATLPQAATIALQCLRDKRPLQPGQKVLINGAGGGVGTFAVQLARFFGAEVTGVDSAQKLDRLRSLGADHVMDYAQDDYTKNGQRYDLILDVTARRSIFDYQRALSPTGIFVMVGGSLAALAQAGFLGPLISRRGTQTFGILIWNPNQADDLAFMIERFEAGDVVPVIDKPYPLSQLAEALRRLEAGQATGKLVISMDDNR